MTDELQAESGITLDNDHIEGEVQTETAESGAELATATEEKQEKIDGAQKAINKQHAKYREEERKRIETEKKLEDANKKLEAIEAEKGEVVIPPIPDPYEDDFEEKLKAREDAITRNAQKDAQQQSALDKQNAQREAVEKANQERVQVLIDDYDKRIGTLGLDANDIARAGKTVVDYGISGEVAEFILQQEDGPLITKYLADNPLELDDLRNMQPIDAALRINSTIKEAASALKPQASNAPDPVETLNGRGASEQVSPLIKGATFE
jgi:multidrug efflux pump subunit AcrB